MTYGGFKRMTTFCKTDVPPAISDALEAVKDNDEAVKAYGIQLGAEMCRQLLDAGEHCLLVCGCYMLVCCCSRHMFVACMCICYNLKGPAHAQPECTLTMS